MWKHILAAEQHLRNQIAQNIKPEFLYDITYEGK